MHNNVYVNKVKGSIIEASLDTMGLSRVIDFLCRKQEQGNMEQSDIHLLVQCLEKHEKSQDTMKKTLKTFIKSVTGNDLDEVDAVETDNGFQL